LLAYWAVFAFFAVGALSDASRPPDMKRFRPGWLLGGALILILIGFRYEVGADWHTYQFIFSYTGFVPFMKALSLGDPAYQALNWIVRNVDGEVVWVNVVCAALFTWGLFRLARVQPYPWLAILVAVPYMVIVASMYTRQAAALGILMAGLSSLVRGGSLVRFVIYVGAATMFHRTAIAVLPLIVLSRPTNRIFNILGGLAAFYALFDVFLADSVEDFVSNYIEQRYSAQGAAIRVAMDVLAASVFLIRRKDFGFPPAEDRMWFYFALASFAALVFLLLSPSTAAVDRLSLYLMPLQVVILSRVPFVFTSRTLGVVLVAVYCFAVQFVWLNFANHAEYWLPYQFYPLFS
jgi:hypothetical protein